MKLRVCSHPVGRSVGKGKMGGKRGKKGNQEAAVGCKKVLMKEKCPFAKGRSQKAENPFPGKIHSQGKSQFQGKSIPRKYPVP